MSDPGTGHGTVQFTFTGSPFSSQVMNFGFYIIDATKVIFISTDVAGANLAILSGTMYKQAKSSFGLSDMACGLAPDTNPGCVFAMSGESGLGSHISAGRAVGSASGTLTLQSDDNKAGTVTSTTAAGSMVTVMANGVGTITPPAGASPAGFVLIDTDTGILGFVGGSEQVGLFKPQTTLAVSTTPETFILGSQLVADGKVANDSGVVRLATPTSGNLAGKLDFELPVSPL